MNDLLDLDPEWDPMKAEYENPDINCYEHGPGVNMDVHQQRPAYRNRQDKPVYKLHVSNIPSNLTEMGVENLFMHFGNPTVSKIHLRNGQNGFAFVEYQTLQEADSALRAIHNLPPFCMRVNYARSDATKQRMEQRNKVEEEMKKTLAQSSTGATNWYQDIPHLPQSISSSRHTSKILRLGRGKLLVKAFPSSNSRRCEWSKEDSDVSNPKSLLPDTSMFSTSNKVLHGLVVMATDGARRVSLGRGFIPPNQSDQTTTPNSFSLENQGVYRQGEDIVVPKLQCSLCNNSSVLKCCQCGEPYCSIKCQKADFPSHKSKCSPKMSIDITFDSKSLQRTIKLGTLCQRMDTSDTAPTSSEKSVLWTQSENHALDSLTPGKSVLFRLVSKDFPSCIGILSCQELFEETKLLVVDLPDHFKNVNHDESFRPAEGTLVCVKHENSFWRGYILAASTYGTTRPYQVALCDRGQIVTVPFENIYRLPAKFLYVSELSVKCTVVESGDVPELWNSMIEENDYCLQVYDTDFSVSATLLKDDKPIGKFSFDRWNPILKQKKASVIPLDPPCRVVISAYHDQHSVYVRRIGKSYQEELFRILQKVATVHVTAPPLGRHPRKGELVACQFDKDKNFYRALVCEKNENSEFQVLFVDFGNVEWVSAGHMKSLPEDLKMLPFMAIKVSLIGVPTQPLTEEAIMFLNSLVLKEQDLLLECDEDPYLGGVQLFLKGTSKVSVNAELCQLLLPEWKQAVKAGEEPYRGEVFMLHDVRVLPLLLDGSMTGKVRILVLCILPDGRLSVCPVDRPEAEHIVKTLSFQINEYCESFDQRLTYCPRNEEVCLAKFNDGLWYRAVNLRTLSSQACEVMFLDYGNIDKVDLHNVRRMVPDFTRTPCLASLCDIDGVPEEDPMKMMDRVTELVKPQSVYEVEVIATLREGEYKIHIPEISKQLLSEAVQ